jgi:hypothetical protein
LPFAAGRCKHIESLCIYFEGGDCGHNFFLVNRKNPFRAVIAAGRVFDFWEENSRYVGRWSLHAGERAPKSTKQLPPPTSPRLDNLKTGGGVGKVRWKVTE